MINWEYVGVTFVKQAGNWENYDSAGAFLEEAIHILKRISGAYMVVFIAYGNGGTAVKHATASYLKDITLDDEKIKQVAAIGTPVCMPQKGDSFFNDLFPALASAAFAPVAQGGNRYLLAMGWSAKQDFDITFTGFMELVQQRLKEACEYFALKEELEQAKNIYTINGSKKA